MFSPRTITGLKAFRLRTVHRIDWVIHKTGAMRSSAAQDAQSLLFVKDLFLIGKFFLTILDKLTAPYAAPHPGRVCHMQLMEGYGRLGGKSGFGEYRGNGICSDMQACEGDAGGNVGDSRRLSSQRLLSDIGFAPPDYPLVDLIAAFLPHTWQVAAHLPPKLDTVIRPDEVDP